MVMDIMNFKYLEDFVTWLNKVKSFKFVHDSEAASLLLFVTQFSVCRLRHMAVEVDSASTTSVDTVGIWHFDSESLR